MAPVPLEPEIKCIPAFEPDHIEISRRPKEQEQDWFYGNNGVFPYGENATQVYVGRWLSDTPVHLDALEIIAEKARRFWWGQQIELATISWSLLLAVEGRRRNIPSLWAYLSLAHLVNLSFAQNLFYLALILTPTPAQSGIVTELFRFLSTASFAFHVKGTALGLLYNAPDAHYHRHSRFLPFDREERSTWERTTTALGKVLGSASDHPVVAGVAWDVLLSGASQGLWAATRALDVDDILASSTPFAQKNAPKAQPLTRLLEGNDKSTPESETGSHTSAISTRRRGRPAKAKTGEMTISKTAAAEGNRRTRDRRATEEVAEVPDDAYEPSAAESRSAVEGDEMPDGDLDWESAALAWGLTALGGLGSSSAGVFGAECTSR
ncbi:hypothetical protein K4K54_011301 [Colletotrichum sp. SAR 10_86]|nr:hypothetical protein K4K54_011301 [Colletotrichum sp. SAR 10_86]